MCTRASGRARPVQLLTPEQKGEWKERAKNYKTTNEFKTHQKQYKINQLQERARLGPAAGAQNR
jgi:hypothetical protein